jgi:hypothetical protein
MRARTTMRGPSQYLGKKTVRHITCGLLRCLWSLGSSVGLSVRAGLWLRSFTARLRILAFLLLCLLCISLALVFFGLGLMVFGLVVLCLGLLDFGLVVLCLLRDALLVLVRKPFVLARLSRAISSSSSSSLSHDSNSERVSCSSSQTISSQSRSSSAKKSLTRRASRSSPPVRSIS